MSRKSKRPEFTAYFWGESGRYGIVEITEKYGYGLIPECYEYLARYPLTQNLLDQVNRLWFDGGLDIYFYMFRYWDGETDDFDVQSLDGLEHQPNLKQLDIISMLDVDALQDALQKAAARGIRINR